MQCTRWRRLPLNLAQDARERAPSGCVDRAVQCQLSTHDDDRHYGFLDDLSYGTALWLWWHGAGVGLAVLSDCSTADLRPGGEGCGLFAGHTEQHTWEENPPSEETDA